MIGLSQPTTITISVVGLFAFLALVALARLALRKDEPGWRKIRFGVFLERDGEPEPPEKPGG